MKIAIKGHISRGKEVIQILESLGGKNIDKLEGYYKTFYYINNENEICDDHKDNFPPTYKLYTLEEFEKEFPFKVGDKVITNDDRIGVIEKLIPGDTSPYCVKINNVKYWGTQSSLKLYTEMKEERNITLTLDKAKEWYKKGGELKEVALQAYSEEELTKVELPKTWEEFCENYPKCPREAYINQVSDIYQYSSKSFRQIHMNKNVCPSKKSAEAHLAMIQLEQLRDCWRQGWKPDWNDEQQSKYCIVWCNEKFKVSILYTTKRFLSFPTTEMASEFLKCFGDLIEKAGDLI